MVLKLPWPQKQMFWAFNKGIFQFYPNLWVTKLKPLSGKGRQSVENYLNEFFFQEKPLTKEFSSYLETKPECFQRLKRPFLWFFCQFLSGEVKTIFWEIEAKHSNIFKSKFGHRKFLRKRFWSCLELKRECCEHFKRAFFKFLQIFEWQSWNRFLGKWGKEFKTI